MIFKIYPDLCHLHWRRRGCRLCSVGWWRWIAHGWRWWRLARRLHGWTSRWSHATRWNRGWRWWCGSRSTSSHGVRLQVRYSTNRRHRPAVTVTAVVRLTLERHLEVVSGASVVAFHAPVLLTIPALQKKRFLYKKYRHESVLKQKEIT